MRQILKISATDFSLIFRDPSLKTFLFLPFLIFVVLLWGLPALIQSFPIVGDFTNYIVLVATIQSTQMFGFIYGMMLVDEKETGIAKVYGVVPVNKFSFILGRFMLPVILTILLTWLLLLIQPFYELAIFSSLLFAILTGLIVPVYAIAVSLLSKTRIEALVWVKVMNILVVLPVLAFFIPGKLSHLFGLLPSHWLFQGMEQMIRGEGFILNWVVGFGFLALLIIGVSLQFSKKHYA